MKDKYTKYHQKVLPLLLDLETVLSQLNASDSEVFELQTFLRKWKKADGSLWRKEVLLAAYRELAGTAGLAPLNDTVVRVLRKRPVRTLSGVAPITVLTKPFPCPGKCIFCPSDVRMPKSYLADEPGAQRAERNYFDPYLQTYNRLLALHINGHTVDKAEIIVLGGTWSFYPEPYQIWFISECFRALNDFQRVDGRDEVLEHYRKMEAALLDSNQPALSAEPTVNKERFADRVIDGSEMLETYNQVVSELYVAPDRLGGFDAYQSAQWETLFAAQKANETARTRCVGLVIETRPDNISEQEVIRIRKLGCTKTQIGFQSLQDSVLEANNRGHNVAATRNAVRLLRQAGFKIHAHWMANLYGSSVAADKEDFAQLFSDPDFCPDELKIYPCSLIGTAELMQYFSTGKWHPYTRTELNEVLTHCLVSTPPYCRLTRIIRDIPSTDIVEGNKLTNFRQVAEASLKEEGKYSQDIRAREIRHHEFDHTTVEFSQYVYETSSSTEYFLQFTAVPVSVQKKAPVEKNIQAKQAQQAQQAAEALEAPEIAVALKTAEVPETTGTRKPTERKLLAFLRLSLPKLESFLPELRGRAIIREVHVYGVAQGIGVRSDGKTQHKGLGTQLLEKAKEVSAGNGFSEMSVISAVGTREYYRKLGFQDGELYQHISVA